MVIGFRGVGRVKIPPVFKGLVEFHLEFYCGDDIFKHQLGDIDQRPVSEDEVEFFQGEFRGFLGITFLGRAGGFAGTAGKVIDRPAQGEGAEFEGGVEGGHFRQAGF